MQPYLTWILTSAILAIGLVVGPTGGQGETLLAQVQPQGAPPQGALPQGALPQGAPPQGAPPQGAPPQGATPQGALPQGAPPQGAPPQGARPQGAPPPAPAFYAGEFLTHVLAGGSVNDLRVPIQPANLAQLPENKVPLPANKSDRFVAISWVPTGHESDGNLCPDKDRRASEEIFVRSKRPADNDNTKTLLAVQIPSPPCWWPVMQLARIVVKGEVQGVQGLHTFFDETLPVSTFWFAFLGTALIVTLIYPGCAMAVWFATDRRYKRKAREAQHQGEPLPERPPSLLATLDPVQLTAGPFGRASLAKLQVFVFSLLVFAILLFYQLRCGLLAGISNDVLYLMGISAVGAAGGKVAYMTKRRLSLENWAWLRRRRWLPDKRDVATRAKWSELLLDSDTKEFDPYSFQMAVFSLVVAVALIETNFAGLGSFSIPTQLLQLLGLSQVVFIGGKAIEKSAYNDLDQKLSEVRQNEIEYQILTVKQQGAKKILEAGALQPEGALQPRAEASQQGASTAQPGAGASQTEIKDPEIARKAFKTNVAQAAEMFWAIYGDQIGDKPPELENADKLEPELP